jgi:hypothetical protein
MTYSFRPAVREQCYTLTGFAGPSGSGKTFSALSFAQGLAGGGKIAMIDTEARRGLHYADQFQYLYSELTAPFTPERYIEAIQAAQKAGASVIIVDSMSHEHEGPGGVLEMHEAELTRMAGDNWAKREQCKFAAWIKPKRDHNRFVNTILQIEAHIIFCFRAKEKLKLIKNDKGKMEPMPQGWQPICSDRFEYECTALLMLPPNSKGRPDFQEGATKLQEQHRAIFDSGRSIDADMGKALAAWAAGGEARSQDAPANEEAAKLLAEAREVASLGKDRLQEYWKGLKKPQKEVVNQIMEDLKAAAIKADEDAAAAERGGDDAVDSLFPGDSEIPFPGDTQAAQ